MHSLLDLPPINCPYPNPSSTHKVNKEKNTHTQIMHRWMERRKDIMPTHSNTVLKGGRGCGEGGGGGGGGGDVCVCVCVGGGGQYPQKTSGFCYLTWVKVSARKWSNSTIKIIAINKPKSPSALRACKKKPYNMLQYNMYVLFIFIFI